MTRTLLIDLKLNLRKVGYNVKISNSDMDTPSVQCSLHK